MQNFNLGIIGAGNMAGAIINGVLTNGLLSAQSLYVSDTDESKLQALKDKGVRLCASNSEVVKHADVIVLAIKPQSMREALEQVKGQTAGKCLVSIAAGVPSSFIKSILGEDSYVVRVMPNTPMLLGQGAIAVAQAPYVPQALYDAAVSVFSCSGQVVFLPEEQLNEIIGVNGSSPAFFFRMAKAMRDAARKQGIDPDVALSLIIKTMEGSAAMLRASGRTPEELIKQVSSPGGTTVAALCAFDELKFDALIEEAMARCTRRAYELSAF